MFPRSIHVHSDKLKSGEKDVVIGSSNIQFSVIPADVEPNEQCYSIYFGDDVPQNMHQFVECVSSNDELLFALLAAVHVTSSRQEDAHEINFTSFSRDSVDIIFMRMNDGGHT